MRFVTAAASVGTDDDNHRARRPSCSLGIPQILCFGRCEFGGGGTASADDLGNIVARDGFVAGVFALG